MQSTRHKSAPWGWCLLAAALLVPAVVRAQVGSTTDIITGQVKGPGDQPIVGATVIVTSIDTHISRAHTTNSDGRYTVVFPDGGGQYRVEIRAVGYTPSEALIQRQADEDRLVANIQLSSTVHTLATVVTTGRRNAGPDAANAGSTGMTLTPSQIEKLPIDGNDLATLAALSPGVVGLSSTDTTATSFSVAGQRQTLNATTVDGLTFAGASVPTEAVRNIRVVTNSYDVSRGQFTGGQIATTTRGGTDDVAGSFGLTLRNDNLAFGAQGPATYSQLRNQYQLSGGVGGPIVRDKVFTFTALMVNHRYDNLISLLNAGPSTLGPLGISQDTAAAFLNQVRNLGIPTTSANVPTYRGVTNVVGFQRFDFLLSDDETLTLRADYRATAQDGSRVSVFSLPTDGTATSQSAGGLMLALTSHLGDATINDFRTYVTHQQTSLDPYLRIPTGRVTIVPQVDSDETGEALGYGVSSLSFGGSSALPSETFNNYVESTDEVSVIPGDGSHRIKLGGLVNIAEFGQTTTPNQEGVYSYTTFQQFMADSPATFSREFNVQNTNGKALNAATYIGDAWRDGPLQLTYGARVEASAYGGAPAYNPTIDSLFHRKTDDWPSEIHASPRVGFTWLVGSGNGRPGGGGGRGGGFRQALMIVRGGFGEFRAPTPQSLFSSLQSQNGEFNAERQLYCVGPQVPTPDWEGFADGEGAPTTCTGGVFPADTLGLGARSAVTTFAPDFEAPRAWRGSLGASRRLFQRITVSVDGTYARGVALFGVSDLNLDTVPKLRLANEANRPVYAFPGEIDPGTGAAAFGASRLYPQYAQVLSLNSNLQSDTRQVTTSINGFTDRGILYTLAYTYSRVRDQSSFSGGSAVYGFASPTTAGNPNVVPFGTSDLQRSDQFVGTLTYPVNALIEVTAIVQLLSGAPYTPMVNGDINGDGSNDDRAFIFNPNTPGLNPQVAQDMRTLLTSGPGRSCLQSQLGQVAGRNSCFGPWTESLNWQVNIRPAVAGLDRRLTIQLQLLNTLAGLDLALHGPNHLEGWGQPFAPDRTLLTVTGFNPATDEYNYTVNTHFGRQSSLQAYGQPFVFVIGGRLNVGPPDAIQQLRGLFGGGRGGGGGGGGGGGPGGRGGPGGAGAAGAADAGQSHEDLADEIVNRFTSRLPNPFAQIIALKDTLVLSPDQLAKLQASSDSFNTRVDSLATSARTQLKKLGANLDATTMFGIMRREFGQVRDIMRNALNEAQQELTPGQWALLPESIRSPTNPRGRNGQNGANGANSRRPPP